MNTKEKPADKHQALGEALRQGKGHLLPKQCTDGFISKAPDEAIEKTCADCVKRKLHENEKNVVMW